MAWESAAIGLLTDALKSILGRIMKSGQERRAAQLISEATRELLLEHPHIEEVKSKLIEAEGLLKTPSPELLHAKFFLDRVSKDNVSARYALMEMENYYHLQGDVKGLAKVCVLSGTALLEDERFSEASESFQKAIEMFTSLNDLRSVLSILPNTLKAYHHQGRIKESLELIKAELRRAITYGDVRSQFEILVLLGNFASACDLKLLAFKAFSMSLVISSLPKAQQTEKFLTQIKNHSESLSISNDQSDKIINHVKKIIEMCNVNDIVSFLFNDEA